jgi:hypothetical protein
MGSRGFGFACFWTRDLSSWPVFVNRYPLTVNRGTLGFVPPLRHFVRLVFLREL